MSQRLTSDDLHKRHIMEELKRACIEGDLIEVRKYMCTVKQPSFPFKEIEKVIKPLVYWAAKAGKVDVLKELIEIYKCDPHYVTERGHTLLYVACARGHADVVKYLVRNCGVNSKQKNDMQSTPLFVACNNGHLEAMLVLIDELKCDPNAVNDKVGESLLHRACGGGHIEVVKCLITKYNLPPEARSNYMDTPLHDACAKGHLPVVQYLIETHKCKISVFNKMSSTPLHIACRNGHSNVVHYLVVDQNCDVALYDNSGSTPFHLACKFRRKEVVRVLLNSGRIDPNLPTLEGEAPIMMSKDPDIVRCLIRSGAKPVGAIPGVLDEFIKKAPLDSLVHIFMIGHSEAGKSTLARALQMPVSTYLGGLITRANTVANDLGRTAGIIPMEFKSPDFGRVLLYDFAGHPEFHASHGALLEHFNTNTAPLFLLVVDLNESMTDVQRKINYWLSFVETHRLPGVSPPRVMIIGSHYDLLKKKAPLNVYTTFTSQLERYVRSRLKNSKLCLEGYFVIDCRDPKRHNKFRQCLKKSCECLRVYQRIDSCCHVLNVFLTKEFDKQLACTIEDIIQKAKTSETYPLPLQVAYLCDLVEELSTRLKLLFLRNKEIPEKSWIILDIDTLLSKINGRIFAPDSLPEHCLTPVHTGVLPVSQIQQNLPDLDLSLVVSFLGHLEFCHIIQDPKTFSLINFGKCNVSNFESDEGANSPTSTRRQSLCSEISSSSCQSYSSGISSHITGSSVLSENELFTSKSMRENVSTIALVLHHPDGSESSGISSLSKYTEGSRSIYSTNNHSSCPTEATSSHASLAATKGLFQNEGIYLSDTCLQVHDQDKLPTSINGELSGQGDLPVILSRRSKDSTNSSPQSLRAAAVVNSGHTLPYSHTSLSPGPTQHYPSTNQASVSLQQSGNPPPSVAQSHGLSVMQQHQSQNGVPHFIENSATLSNATVFQNLEHISHQQNASSQTIVTPPSLPTPLDPQVFSPPGSSGMGGLLSPLDARPPQNRPSTVSHSLFDHSSFSDKHERRRQMSSLPQYSQASKLHDQMQNLHLSRATEGGSQPSLPEEQAQLPGGSHQLGSVHQSPSDSCTLEFGQPQHQCTTTQAQSQGGSSRMSHHMGCAQSPVFNDKFLFFPGLVNSGQPSSEMWLEDESFVFYSGWCLESALSHKFFTPRFFQTLILRLTFGFAVTRISVTSSSSQFSREYTIWKNGLRWLNLDGVETFVEMVEDERALILLMRAKKDSELKGVSLRTALIRKILNTKEEFCPDMPTSEYLIHPKHLQERESYPIITDRLSCLIRYNIGTVAQAIVAENQQRPFRFAIDTLRQNAESLINILHFDPYMYLNSDTLEKLFNPTNQDQELSEDLLLDFSRDYPDDADKFQEILLDESHNNKQHSPTYNPCFEVLRRYWERVPNLKVSDFRQDLDQYSIFAGRNVLELVHVCETPYTFSASHTISLYANNQQQKMYMPTYDHSSCAYKSREQQKSITDIIACVPSRIHSQSSPSINEQTSFEKCDASSSSFRGFVNRTYFCHFYKHVVKKYFYCAEKIASVPFLGQVEVLEFDSSGGEYKSNNHGITISIPKGAIPQGETVHMEVAVALFGPFQFSDGKRPISPILWLCPQENVVFQKPITIVLPHMLTDVCNKDVDKFGIQFAKADHTDYRVTPAGTKEYNFRLYKSEVVLQASSTSGKHCALLKADHCCFLCLEMKQQNKVTPEVARQMAKKMGYFIYCVECLQSPYPSTLPPRDVIYFCVSFMLPTCMKAIEDQFPLKSVHGEFIHKIHTQRINLNDPHLQILYSTNDKDLCDVAISNEGKIYASRVDFWEEGLDHDLLKSMHESKVYPPRIEMSVQLMNHEQRHIKISVNFEGCCSDRDSPKFQLFFPLGHRSDAAAAIALSSTIRKNGIKVPKHGYYPEWTPTQPRPSIPHKSDKPNLRQLQRLCRGCTKVTVLKTIAPKWKELAIEMGFEYSEIKTVDMANKDPKNAVCEILGGWLEGTVASDTRPLTWSTLVECLSNIECQSLADELSQILLD